MKESARWNKGQSVYTRNDWPHRQLYIRESRPMLASKKPCASDSWDSTSREIVPWPAPGRVTRHRLSGGSPGDDPTALFEGPDGEVVVAEELAGEWHGAKYGVATPAPVRAPSGGTDEWFVCLWLLREDGMIKPTFSVAMSLSQAQSEVVGYQALGYIGRAVKAREITTYPG